MRRFIKTVVPVEGYEEVKKVGNSYVVHMEPVSPNGDDSDTVECYETMTDDEPDMAALTEELRQWKHYICERELDAAKSERIKALLDYDTSTAVNSFEIRRDGVKLTDYWIPRDLRTSLEGDVMAASAVGDTYDFDIREMGITLSLDCNKFLAALNVLRQYAYTCYNVTSRHMAAINALQTVAEVEQYDFTVGYPPEKLVFNIEDLV